MEDGVLFTKQTISIQEAIEILQNQPVKDAVATPPKKPKAEQAFLFVADSSGKEGNVFIEGWRQSSIPKEATLNLTNKIPQQPRFLLVGSAYCVFDFSF